ncbi:hypothetical protein [Dysgonomonas sp. BGC7]|uniref:hypothetical protein n=1 Tax=Dysgonomonas sp. BGC7 TaxID=1658008 RepID=UPI0006835BC8|nr:hypothetical protein [Dysgonomonas sp. BGC7]MBD8389295.1 hypothetical protein [Dysgonomonas sp. BGC7]
MGLDKISDERLFQNNTKEEISSWCKQLQYFHYMRSRGGHNCEGDSFCVYFKYDGLGDLKTKLGALSITLSNLKEGDIAFDPLESYSFDDLDKLKIVIPCYTDVEQPQYVELFGYKAHVWVMDFRFEISISGTKDGQTYKVSDEDFKACCALEKEFERLEWNIFLDEDIKSQVHCISRENYPELF